MRTQSRPIVCAVLCLLVTSNLTGPIALAAGFNVRTGSQQAIQIPPARPAKGGHPYVPYVPKRHGVIHLSAPPTTSLLDSSGYLRRPVSSETKRSWRIALSEVEDPATKAKFDVWLAECDISRHEPRAALKRLRAAERIAPTTCRFAGLARFDEALALFLSGRYD